MPIAVLIADNDFVGCCPIFNIASLAADACIERVMGRNVTMYRVEDLASQERITSLAMEHRELNFSNARGAEGMLAKISGKIIAECRGCLVIDDPRPWA